MLKYHLRIIFNNRKGDIDDHLTEHYFINRIKDNSLMIQIPPIKEKGESAFDVVEGIQNIRKKIICGKL
jgi:hypothetical protein